MSAPPTTPPYTPLPDPPPFSYGPSVFEARRLAWLASRGPSLQPPHQVLSEQAQCEAVGRSGGSMSRLEALLSGRGENEEEEGGVLEGDGSVGEEAWRGGLEGVWRGLVGGRRLVKRMPLSLVIKVLKAGWQRDGTWPPSHPPIPSSPPLSSSPQESIINPYPPPARLPPPSPSPPSTTSLPNHTTSFNIPKIHPETLVRQPSKETVEKLARGEVTTTTGTSASASGGGGVETEITTPGGEGEEEERKRLGADDGGMAGIERYLGAGGNESTPKESELDELD